MTTMQKTFFAPFAGAALLVTCSAGAQTTSTGSGQAYPTKPIRMVTAPLGGGSDFTAQIVAQGITGPLGQPVIVDNRPSNIVGDIVAAAPADGYTLAVIGSSRWLAPFVEKTNDSTKNLEPITLAERSTNVLFVHPSVPAKSVKELIALAKAKPGQVNYASSVPGSAHSLLAGELFKAMAGVDIVNTPYKTMGQAVNDLLGGQVQFIFGASALAPHVKAGKLRALAVTAAEPSPLFPDLPTVAASLPGYEVVSVTGVLAPAKTPKAVIDLLNQEIVRYLQTPDVKQKYLNVGAEAVGTTPGQLAQQIKSDMAAMGKIIKTTGARTQ